MSVLRRISEAQASASYGLARRAVTPETLRDAAVIVGEVEARGEAALREYALRFGDIGPNDPLILGRKDLEAALSAEPRANWELLERVAQRVFAFASAQRGALLDVDLPIPGGHARHRVKAVERAGCYAPGGRFPLPSSVLMTAVTAKTAGVGSVWVASPKPARITLAAVVSSAFRESSAAP